jgi:hypothetical protein
LTIGAAVGFEWRTVTASELRFSCVPKIEGIFGQQTLQKR